MTNSCHHVFGETIGPGTLIVQTTGKWLRKCALCKSRQVYSPSMVRCIKCQVLVHDRCVCWTAYDHEVGWCPTAHRADEAINARLPADTVVDTAQRSFVDTVVDTAQRSFVDAATNTEEVAVENDLAGTCGANVRVASGADAACGAVGAGHSATADDLQDDGPTVSASADIVQDDGPSSTSCTCAPGETSTCVPVAAEQPEAADDSDVVPYVLPVMEANRAQELNETYELWETRYALFSRFNEGIMADRATLYSGPPEVLAKQLAAGCKSFGTVMDPFCGSGAIVIQLAMVCGKVIAMDSDPAKVACARNNARVYGVEERIEFVVGDFFAIAHTLQTTDGIVTSPPKNMSKIKVLELIRLASRLAPKVLLNMPKNRDKTVMYQLGSRYFSRVKIEDVIIDRQLSSVNFYLGPMTNRNNYYDNKRKHVAQKIESQVQLFSNGVAVSRRVHWIRGNNLFAYNDYIIEVDNFLEAKKA